MSGRVVALDRSADWLSELAPALRRAVALDRSVAVRLRADGERATALLRLPFGVLAGRSVAAPAQEPLDRTLSAAALLAWLDAAGGSEGPPPSARDTDWRWGVPPPAGWRRLDTVPGEVVRQLVRSGARALADAAAREGVPGAQPRAEVADALLDSVVLTVAGDDGGAAALTLRVLAALIRMGFVPEGSAVSVDQAGRWTRIAGRFGSVYAERPGLGLSLSAR